MGTVGITRGGRSNRDGFGAVVRVRRFFLLAGARATLPEIPCSFDDPDLSFVGYLGCVVDALDRLEEAGIVRRGRAVRLLLQAIRAWNGAHGSE